MRLAAYAGASTALAAGVVIHAFNQRPNFYSACVYLSQSNLSLMILTNLALFVVAFFIYGLQRICYGPLRPIEVEQLYEKGWFAVTETCLAMTIFRDEVGAWFLVMFVALMAGKIWGWVGEGRVEILEQQPPANPRLFHIRLSISLAMSALYDSWLLAYSVSTVIQQARPNMMVMFLFEFAILTTCSFSTSVRYFISLLEARIVKEQTQVMLENRRSEVRRQREEILRERAAATATSESSPAPVAEEPLPSEDDIEEMDIEPPGWEAKGHWVLTLDLMTDFIKLGIYSAFFFILLTFYGLPIHIMRDLFLTARSFIKRLSAFLKYRNATKDMNQRYPDATVDEIQREDTCIICREEMRPWSVTNPAPGAPPNGAPQPPATRSPIISERSRPKKLPCGHVLHLGCLKSWLERQQVCPTCRQPVVDTRPAGAHVHRPEIGAQPQIPGQLPLPHGLPIAQPPVANANVARGAMINIGPLRLAFGRGQMPAMGVPNQQVFPGVQPGQHPIPANARVYGFEMGFPPAAQGQGQGQPQDPHTPVSAALDVQARLHQLEQHIVREIQSLSVSHAELRLVRQLQAELLRLRQLHPGDNQHAQADAQLPGPTLIPTVHRHEPIPGTAPIPSGSLDLPPGVTIPEGWSLLPLQNLDAVLPSTAASHLRAGPLAGQGASSTVNVNGVPAVPAAAAANFPVRSPTTSTGGVTGSDEPRVAPSETQNVAPMSPTVAEPSSSESPSVTRAPETSSGATEVNKESPPDWSSSFLFPGQRVDDSPGGADPGTLLPSSQADKSQESATASLNGSAFEGLRTSEGVSGKGKAKAASVEEIEDDEDV